jgi:hypothetical protein
VGHLRRQLALALVAVAALQPAAFGQTPAAPADEPATVLAGIASTRDRFTWHFDNPSNFDTDALVPHFFEQTYRADNIWLTLTARYTAGVRWESAVAATPSRTTTATDYDTFNEPDGSIVVSGTRGDAAVRGVRASQMADVGRIGRAALIAGYRFRLDRADFGIGHKTVTRNGALEDALDVTTREATTAELHELVMGMALPVRLSAQWTASVRGELSPAIFGRLLVRLPDKYPGRDFVFAAKTAGTLGRVTVARARTRWPVEVTAEASRTWSYRSDARLTRSIVSVGIAVGRTW